MNGKMMQKIILQKHLNSLIPHTDEDKKKLNAYEQGQILVCKTKAPRRPRVYWRLKRYWAICKLVADNAPENMPYLSDKDSVHFHVKVDLRMIKHWVVKPHKKTGKDVVIVEPLSISYEKMSEEEFEAFENRAYPLMASWLNVTKEDLMNPEHWE